MLKEKDILRILRAKRGFNVEDYINKKCEVLTRFMDDESLNAVVVGLSGGIDSAVTYALLSEAARIGRTWSVEPICIPISGAGTSGQNEAVERAKLVAPDCLIFDGGPAYSAITDQSLDFDSYRESNSWARGQMASMLRSPVFYYLAAVLQQYGERSIVAGTINKSEGSYIGYFGKYSDGAVDIQVIADIYKHEVFQVAKELGIPSEIIQETPKGDVWSGVSDEELIGVSYEFLDMYLMLKEFDLKIQDFGPTDDEFLKDFNKSAEIVENLNRINRHKYKHGSGPAAFLDVMPRKIRGGWV